MSSDLAFEWDNGPDSAERLWGEAFASIDAMIPDSCFEDDDQAHVIGTVAARRGDALVGVTEIYDEEGKGGVASMQAAYVPREVRRILSGYYDDSPTSSEEFAAVAGMYRLAAEQLGAAGYRALLFDGMDTAPDGKAAVELRAHPIREYARNWHVEPARWERPEGLPAVTLTKVREPDTDSPEVELQTEHAAVRAYLMDRSAYINVGEAISYSGTDSVHLAALLAELVTRLRENYPGAIELTVFEFEDETIHAALPLAGFEISGRHVMYELPLTR
ncbi:hypothetical protein AB0N05_36170 [Nocardia sp. NPDC051030]|uniref:hypothetical protein n=1 Tax=Nocardia sp. NPDC051030 TaxID=3155162 RepID=UPI00342051E3